MHSTNNIITPQQKLRRSSNSMGINDSPLTSITSPSTTPGSATTSPPSSSSLSVPPTSITGIATLMDGTLANIVLRRSEPSSTPKPAPQTVVSDSTNKDKSTPSSSSSSSTDDIIVKTFDQQNSSRNNKDKNNDDSINQSTEKEQRKILPNNDEQHPVSMVPSSVSSSSPVTKAISEVSSTNHTFSSTLPVPFPTLPTAKDVIKQIPMDTELNETKLLSASSSHSPPTYPSLGLSCYSSPVSIQSTTSPVIQAITAAPTYQASSTVLRDMLDSFARSMEPVHHIQYSNQVEQVVPVSTTVPVPTITSVSTDIVPVPEETIITTSSSSSSKSSTNRLINTYSNEQFAQHTSARIALAAKLQTPKKVPSSTHLQQSPVNTEEIMPVDEPLLTESKVRKEIESSSNNETFTPVSTPFTAIDVNGSSVPKELSLPPVEVIDNDSSLRPMSPCITTTVTFPSSSVPRVPDMLAAAVRARSNGLIVTLRPSSRGGMDINESVVEECETITVEPSPSTEFISVNHHHYDDSIFKSDQQQQQLQRPNAKKLDKTNSFRSTNVSLSGPSNSRKGSLSTASVAQENMHPSSSSNYASSKQRKNSTASFTNRHSRLDLVLQDVSTPDKHINNKIHSIVSPMDENSSGALFFVDHPDRSTSENRTTIGVSAASQEIVPVSKTVMHNRTKSSSIQLKSSPMDNLTSSNSNNLAWQTFATAQLELLQLMRNAHERIMRECDEAKQMVQIKTSEVHAVQEQLNESLKREQSLQEELERLRLSNSSLSTTLTSTRNELQHLQLQRKDTEYQHTESQTDVSSCDKCDRWANVYSTLQSRYKELVNECCNTTVEK